MALGTGLRLAEIVGLNVGDVFTPDGTPRVRVRVRKEVAKGGRAADVFLPDRLVAKSGRRISKRRVQFAWATWQRRAGFDRTYGFHSLRHSSITNVYKTTRDLFLAQRFARHTSPLTTVSYTHPSDDEMHERIRALGC